MNAITTRFFEEVDKLKVTDYSLARNIESVSAQKLSNARNNKNEISIDVVSAVCSYYRNMDSRYILTGVRDTENNYEVKDIFPTKSADIYNDSDIALYDVSAAANLSSILGKDENQNVIDHIRIPNVPKCDGAVYVRGDSMTPLLRSGDIVAFKVINDIRNLIYGEMYLVDMSLEGDDFLVVKYVQRSEKGDDWVRLVSHNTFYDPKDVHISLIRSIALVKFSIRMNTIN